MIFKKCICAIVVLAVALPAVAGDVKVHKPWPTKMVYSWQDVTVIDVCIDVGYYIDIVNQDCIKVTQTSVNGSDPFFTYLGCNNTDIVSNFNATISGTVTSSLSGTWSATFNGVAMLDVPAGTTNVNMCVLGQNVDISSLDGGADNVKVGELTIHVIPTAYKDFAEI